MPEHRRERVAHRLQVELAELLVREVADPRLRAVTITAVRLTADLKQARVFWRTLGDDETERAATAQGLVRATTFLRRRLGEALAMRTTPTLRFEYDTLPDTARRMDALLAATRSPGGGGKP
ncbi:MAG: 30S ribosome-binding factor RbfA [bacterium]|nr:30S ribosome-binding factor RbfA [bacterium]